jgi:deltex-like protein
MGNSQTKNDRIRRDGHPSIDLCTTVTYTAPESLSHHGSCLTPVLSGNPSDGCVICLSSLQQSGAIALLNVCGHKFHRTCITDALKHNKSCPTCRKKVGKLQGKMPSGRMQITTSSTPVCEGFLCGTIAITYILTGGVQKAYHVNPGFGYGPCRRTAYLPDNDDGRKLLKRLKYAFSHGLTFTVGQSLTTGVDNVVTWASIHHKTVPYGGVHGYPDSSYFANCNQELDAVGVPAAEDRP